MNSHDSVNQKLWNTKAKASSRLLELERARLLRFWCEKLDAGRPLPRSKFQIGLAGRRGDGFVILDGAAAIRFVRRLLPVVVDKVQRDLVSVLGTRRRDT